MRIAAALLAGAVIAASSAPAAAEDGVFLQFPRKARVWAQIGQDGMDAPVSEAFLAYLPSTRGGSQRPLQGYLLEAGSTQCDPMARNCPDARATPSVKDPSRLPDKFEIDVGEANGGGIAGEAFLLGAAHGLREGATGRIECVRDVPFCTVSIRYAPRLVLRFLASGKDDALERIGAADGFMRDAIKPGPQPAWGNPASGLTGVEVRS